MENAPFPGLARAIPIGLLAAVETVVRLVTAASGPKANPLETVKERPYKCLGFNYLRCKSRSNGISHWQAVGYSAVAW